MTKKQRREETNFHFKPFWCIFLMVAILCIGSISAETFTFDNVKNYDEETQTVTISNLFGLGKTYSKITLNTPLENKVGLGYQKVAEFTIKGFTDYSKWFKKMKFYNLNDNWAEKEVVYDFKMKVEYEETLDRMVENCDKSYTTENGTVVCPIEKDGTYEVTRYRWDKINPADIKENEVMTIGIFTTTQQGDYVEWIPTFFGVEVDEWASWTASLNTDLVSYYKLDESSGDVIDSVETNDGTNNGATRGVTGKINDAFDFDGTNDYVDIDSMSKSSGVSFSVNAWVYFGSGFSTIWTAEGSSGTSAEHALWWRSSDNMLIFGVGMTDNSLINCDSSSEGDISGGWHMITGTAEQDGSDVKQAIYIDGVSISNSTTVGKTIDDFGGVSPQIGIYNDRTHYMNGTIDELGIWNRTLTSDEITQLYNGGDGMTYIIDVGPEVTHNSPVDNYTSTSSSITFNTTVADDLNVENVTLYINGVLNETNSSGYNGTYIFEKTFLDGDYNWSILAFDNDSQSTQSETRYFSIYAFTLLSSDYSNSTYETTQETFFGQFNMREGTEISLIQLDYNGTNYTITNFTQSDTEVNLTKTITIPLNTNPLANETKTFKFRFTYDGTGIHESEESEQNVSFINLVQCGGDYTTQSLNFTFFDEYNQVNVNGATNKTSIESFFEYWIGNGDVTKNYSFQNLSSSINNYQFCIYPYLPSNYTFKSNVDMEYTAEGFRENDYYLRNSTLTNVSNDILLYLLPEDYATKFFLTFQYGTSKVSDGTITVQKYFTGLGQYQTVAILLTDDEGEATMWQEVDKKYKYSVVQDNVLLGVVERTSICSATPCTLTIRISKGIDDAFESYYDYYAQNIYSNLSFNGSSDMVTYTFVDTTGLANYFRLEVKQTKLNQTGETICDSYLYSSSGTLTCNLTGYEGDFIATSYISRSPELVDKVLGILIDADVLEDLGVTGLFIVMIIIIVIVIAGAVVSRGNPSTVLFLLGISVLGLKLMGIFPFSWVVVVTLEVLIIFMIFKIRT